MHKFLKRRRGKFAAFFLILIGLLIVKKIGLPPYYQTDDAVMTLQTIEGFSKHRLDIKGQKIHYVRSGDADKPIIVFIHGSPGQWTAWADYLLDKDLRDKAHMIAVDRAGFGGSNMGAYEPNLKRQAQFIIEAVADLTKNKKIVVVGHSYGGPVALRMVVDYPDRIHAAILLAPSIDPALEDNRWFNKLAAVSFVRRILPQAVDHSNQEILPLQAELEAMKPLLKDIKSKITVIQGEKDKLVPAGNAEYAQKELIKADVDIQRLPERGHFIPWEEYGLVKSNLLDHLSPSY